MNLPDILAHPDALRRIAQAPRPGLALDFDGTISEIAPTSEAAVLHPRCAAALRRAVADGRFAVVAVVSGRGARDLARKVAIPGVVCIGNHGAERITESGVYELARADGGAEAVAAALSRIERATAGVDGLVYENKGFSASIHYRAAADTEAARRALGDAQAAIPNADAAGVETFWGKMILELRPVHSPNKGDALATLVADSRLNALLFAGDDTTDIDAMRRLSTLAGVDTLGVAVVSDGAPPSLLDAADYSANGVEAVGDMLDSLAEMARAGA